MALVAARRQQWVARHQLSAPLVSVSTSVCEVFLYRQTPTGALYCITSAAQSLVLASVMEGVGWLTYENQRCVYGFLPPSAVAAEVLSSGRIVQAPWVSADAFLCVVELPDAVTVRFRDGAGQLISAEQLPRWEPPRVTLLGRVREALQRWQRSLRRRSA